MRMHEFLLQPYKLENSCNVVFFLPFKPQQSNSARTASFVSALSYLTVNKALQRRILLRAGLLLLPETLMGGGGGGGHMNPTLLGFSAYGNVPSDIRLHWLEGSWP